MTDLLHRLQASLADRYTIEREIGAGGMATVYLAHDQKLGRQVALKVLRPELAASIGSERFLREIQIAAKLTHPKILALYDCGRTAEGRDSSGAGFLYYTMPFVEEESLRDRLNREKQLPIDDALRITQELAEALDHAHSLGIVHRDIKPENILFTAGHAVLSDFGIARAVTEAGGEALTETGLAVGTPAYMSPEQAAGQHDLDGRSDIYSAGCVLYEMLIGEPPFSGPTPQSVMARHSIDPVPPLRTVRASIPAAVEAATMRALEKVPADRYATAAQLASALEKAISESPAESTATDAPGQTRRSGIRRSVLPAVLVAVLATVIVAWQLLSGRADQPASSLDRPSVAVLPFASLSGNPDAEYFGDGMTEELIHALANLDGIDVASRTSVFAFKGRDEDVRVIGAQLDVGTVLEGSVRQAGDQLRITAQLIDVETGFHIWSQEYLRTGDDVFAIQDEIALAIVAKLKPSLVPEETATLVGRGTESLEAYHAYLRGRYFWNQRTPDGLQRAIGEFHQALAFDPTYALAYSGLGDAFVAIGSYQFLPPAQIYPQARTAAKRALALDSSLAEAHVALANALLLFDFDFANAERHFRYAVELDPRYTEARIGLAGYLAAVGRSEEGLGEVRAARDLDPLSAPIAYALGRELYRARLYTESVSAFDTLLSAQPNYFPAYSFSGLAMVHAGQPEQAVRLFERAIGQVGPLPAILAPLGVAHVAAGDSAAARTDLARLVGIQSSDQYVPAYFVAGVHAVLGQDDETIAMLRRAYEERSAWLLWLDTERIFDRFRGDARYEAIRRDVGLP